MQEEDDPEIERYPRQVEHCRGPHARQEIPDLIEIADRLQSIEHGASPQRNGMERREDAVAHLVVDPDADAGHEANAHHIQHAVDEVESAEQNREPDEGCEASGGQNAVIDLEHVKGSSEREQIDHA